MPIEAMALRERAEALLLVSPPDAAISERTAAQVLSAPLPASLDTSSLHLTLPGDGFHMDRAGVVCHRRDLPADQILEVGGLRVTSGERTFVDLAHILSLQRLVAAGDHFVRHGLLDRAQLESVIRSSVKQRGIRAARVAAPLLDGRAESAPESEMRVLMWLANLPPAVPNAIIRDSHGGFLARGDLVLEEWLTVFEYDGEHHLTRQRQAQDADRRHLLTINGWQIVTFVGADLRDPLRFERKATSALVARGYDPFRGDQTRLRDRRMVAPRSGVSRATTRHSR